MRQTQSSNRIFINVGKAAFTGCLVILLAFLIQYYRGKAVIKKINYFIPHSHDHLVNMAAGLETPDQTQLKEFEHYYRLLVKYRPLRADAHGMLGFCQFHLGKTEEAIAAYQQAAGLSPGFFWYHYNLGVIYFKTGRYAQAIQALSQAMKTQPSYAFLFIRSSERIYVPMMAARAAISDISLLEQMRRDYGESLKLLSIASFRIKNYRNMLGFASFAIQGDYDQEGIFSYYAALASAHLNQFENALPYIQESIARNPQSAVPYRALGMILNALDQKDGARNAYQMAERLQSASQFLNPFDETSALQIF